MMEKRMLKVRVAPRGGRAKVVKEGAFGRYHTEGDGVFEVPASSYYYRRLVHGDLEIVADKPKAKPEPDKPKGDEK